MVVCDYCGKNIEGNAIVRSRPQDWKSYFFCNKECQKKWKEGKYKKIDLDRRLITGKLKKADINPDTNEVIEIPERTFYYNDNEGEQLYETEEEG